jgi:hypothetical protein
MTFWDDTDFPPCGLCGRRSHYSVDWDSHCCLTCNIWLEEGCGCTPEMDAENIECPFSCWDRPHTPLFFLNDVLEWKPQ